MIGMTVCSGIGAPELSAPWIDWRYQSEIEPFPCDVLAHRFPDAMNLGDMTNFEEWPDANVDVLCGGTPCQSFSVAGLRKGLDDPRGNLMLTYLAIARRYRPRWLVWENVPGVLSSNGGRDFGSLLRGMGELGYGFAYRVLDAQYVRTRRFQRAVPQRRRRVFVVAYLGDWRRAAAVLFDGESLSGNHPPRREAGEEAAKCLTRGACQRLDWETEDFVTQQVAGTMKACRDSGGWSNSADHVQAVAFDLAQITSKTNRSQVKPVSPTLMKDSQMHTAQPWAVRRLTPTECHRLQGFPDDWCRIPWRGKPVEQCPDGPQYKALGNSWAVNCGEWIFDNIRRVDAMEEAA